MRGQRAGTQVGTLADRIGESIEEVSMKRARMRHEDAEVEVEAKPERRKGEQEDEPSMLSRMSVKIPRSTVSSSGGQSVSNVLARPLA